MDQGTDGCLSGRRWDVQGRARRGCPMRLLWPRVRRKTKHEGKPWLGIGRVVVRDRWTDEPEYGDYRSVNVKVLWISIEGVAKQQAKKRSARERQERSRDRRCHHSLLCAVRLINQQNEAL